MVVRPHSSLHLDVFIQVDGLVVDVVSHEEVVDAGQQRHLWQREDVHELLQGVAVGALRRQGTGGQHCSRRATAHHISGGMTHSGLDGSGKGSKPLIIKCSDKSVCCMTK